MYKITYNETSEVLESLDYVKLQKNNVMVLCKAEEAQGILTKDHSSILAIAGKGLENSYPLVDIQRINLDQYLEEYLKPMKQENQMLTDCIMEMSEIVYA